MMVRIRALKKNIAPTYSNPFDLGARAETGSATAAQVCENQETKGRRLLKRKCTELKLFLPGSPGGSKKKKKKKSRSHSPSL